MWIRAIDSISFHFMQYIFRIILSQYRLQMFAQPLIHTVPFSLSFFSLFGTAIFWIVKMIFSVILIMFFTLSHCVHARTCVSVCVAQFIHFDNQSFAVLHNYHYHLLLFGCAFDFAFSKYGFELIWNGEKCLKSYPSTDWYFITWCTYSVQSI